LDEELQTNLNVKPLGVFQPEPIEIVSNKSVRTLDDWKGLNVAGATYYGPELVKVLGGSPVFVPFPDFYSSLEKGVVDAILDAPSFTVTGKIYEVATYQTFSMALGSSHGFIVNVDVWNAMPAEIQDILMDEAKTAAANLNQTMLDMFYSDSEFCAEQGIEQYFLPKAERDKWIEKASSFIAEQEALMGDIGQQIKQLANEANEKYPYPY
ncbi:MAG: TRAP transporter substrate-binding protein DctP, partial [Dehalococcoidia bacterium]